MLGSHFQLTRWATGRLGKRLRRISWGAAILIAGLLVFGVSLGYARINLRVPRFLIQPTQAFAFLWGFLATAYFLLIFAWRKISTREVRPERRKFLTAAGTAALVAPAAITGYGVFLQRTRIRPREVKLAVPNLHPDLQGLRIAQISDIHLSMYLSAREFAPAIGLANECKPHLIAVTGDLISWRGDPLDTCLDQLAQLRSDAGVVGCMGNHELYAQCQQYTAEAAARRGMRFLRQQTESLRFGKATVHVAGVDYQKMHSPYLQGAESLLNHEPQTLNLLLSHNPDVFPTAAAQGWDIVLSGHTHGGQVTVEYVNQYANIARFYTPYVSGLYRKGPSSIYVNQGIGTIGLPVRLGTEPEVGIITLCAT